MTGRQLFEILIHATGLPEQSCSREVERLLTKSHRDVETLTIEDLRDVLADYLQDVLVETKEDLTKHLA